MLRITCTLTLLLALFACGGNPYQQGEIMYNLYCANCHMEDGSGLKGVIPPLAKSDFLVNRADEVACIIRNGIDGEMVVNGKTYNQAMPGVRKLTDFEINNIINYIHRSWGNDLEYVKIQKVQKDLVKCP